MIGCAVVELHFHPEHGSTYWLGRQEQLGWDVRDRVRTAGRPPLARSDSGQRPAPLPAAGLHPANISLVACIASSSAKRPAPADRLQATAYRDDEFQAAFITPFLRVAEATGFPRGEPWLWVGPSGPHIIGKVVRELARQTGSMDPFSVDFDPRWAKRLADGSFARQRYLDHVTAQALDILEREEVGVLFTTPPALTALAARMSEQQRSAIHGVHYGGLSVLPGTMNEFRELVSQRRSPGRLWQYLVRRGDGSGRRTATGTRLFPAWKSRPVRGGAVEERPSRRGRPIRSHRANAAGCFSIGSTKVVCWSNVMERDEAEAIRRARKPKSSVRVQMACVTPGRRSGWPIGCSIGLY